MRFLGCFPARLLAIAVAIASAGSVAVAGQTPSPAAATFVIPKSTYTPPKTPWGDPDLQGVWDNHNVIPMQRPANLAGKKIFTDAELAAFASSRAGNGTDAVCTTLDEKCAQATVAQVDKVTPYNGWWTPLDYVKDNRTALIEDPADGRIPALTPAARAARDAFEKIHPPSDEDTANSDVKARHWEDFDTRTRCIAIQVPSGVMAYNSANYIIQSPGWVGIVLERLNTRWIPLDGRPHLGPKMRSWLGDSRGHWEGNTLVVETTNFLDQPTNGGGGSVVPTGVSQGNVRVVEHFVPVGPNRIHYYATLEDPTTWVRPWTFMQPWEKDRKLTYDDSLGRVGEPEPYQMYEYACHEGNHAIGAILKANLLEAQAGPKAVDTRVNSTSLIGKSEAEIRAMFGAPVEIAGPRWEYGTANGILQFWAFFEGGKVVRVRPDDLPLDQIEKTP